MANDLSWIPTSWTQLRYYAEAGGGSLAKGVYDQIYDFWVSKYADDIKKLINQYARGHGPQGKDIQYSGELIWLWDLLIEKGKYGPDAFKHSLMSKLSHFIENVKNSKSVDAHGNPSYAYTEDQVLKGIVNIYYSTHAYMWNGAESRAKTFFSWVASMYAPYMRPYLLGLLPVYNAVQWIWKNKVAPFVYRNKIALDVAMSRAPGPLKTSWNVVNKTIEYVGKLKDALLDLISPGRWIKYLRELSQEYEIGITSPASKAAEVIGPALVWLESNPVVEVCSIALLSLAAGYFLGDAIFDWVLPKLGIEFPKADEQTFKTCDPDIIAQIRREAAIAGGHVNDIVQGINDVRDMLEKGIYHGPIDPITYLNTLEKEVDQIRVSFGDQYTSILKLALKNEIDRLRNEAKVKKVLGAEPPDNGFDAFDLMTIVMPGAMKIMAEEPRIDGDELGKRLADMYGDEIAKYTDQLNRQDIDLDEQEAALEEIVEEFRVLDNLASGGELNPGIYTPHIDNIEKHMDALDSDDYAVVQNGLQTVKGFVEALKHAVPTGNKKSS